MKKSEKFPKINAGNSVGVYYAWRDRINPMLDVADSFLMDVAQCSELQLALWLYDDFHGVCLTDEKRKLEF